MTSKPSALVLGATGGIGGEVARLLVARGWIVRALHRHPVDAAAAGTGRAQIVWVEGDAISAPDVIAAAAGASVIVHAVNPPGYRDWGKLVLPMLDNTILAAAQSGARILLPGTLYNYGPDAFSNLTEGSAQRPLTRKGLIRVEMEHRLRRAAAQGSPALIVRAGDFFGPRAANNWFARGLVKPGRSVSAVTNPGGRGVGHQWAYLPDVAETMVRLLERQDRLDAFATYHMEGHWDADGTQMVAAIGRVVGEPKPALRAFPWRLIQLMRPLVPLFGELAEMRYLWNTPVRMSNARLLAVLGDEPHTPLDDAVRATLDGLGCLA